MYSQINIFIEFSCFNRRNNNTTTKRQLEQFAESESMLQSGLTLCLVFYDLDFLLWDTTCCWRWPIASNNNSNNNANKRQQQRETTRRHLQVTLAELMSRQKCDRCPKKNSSPAALWLIPSNWSRSTAGCLRLPLAINTYSFGYGYRRVWGITTRTSRNINININIRVRIRIEIEIEWNNYCGFKFAELDILWHYSRTERSVSNCIVCRVIELVVHKIESLDWPPPERKFMNYAHPLPHANILSTYRTKSWVNNFALWGNYSHF